MSGSSDVLTSPTRRSLSELACSLDFDLWSRDVWTSRTQGSLSELSTCRDLDWGSIWRKLAWVP